VTDHPRRKGAGTIVALGTGGLIGVAAGGAVGIVIVSVVTGLAALYWIVTWEPVVKRLPYTVVKRRPELPSPSEALDAAGDELVMALRAERSAGHGLASEAQTLEPIGNMELVDDLVRRSDAFEARVADLLAGTDRFDPQWREAWLRGPEEHSYDVHPISREDLDAMARMLGERVRWIDLMIRVLVEGPNPERELADDLETVSNAIRLFLWERAAYVAESVPARQDLPDPDTADDRTVDQVMADAGQAAAETQMRIRLHGETVALYHERFDGQVFDVLDRLRRAGHISQEQVNSFTYIHDWRSAGRIDATARFLSEWGRRLRRGRP
jgi:hypothetical protein